MVFALIALSFIVVPLIWIFMKIAPWAAPVTALIGLVIAFVGLYTSLEVAGFGLGLFIFSSVLFVSGGGMDGR